MNELKEKLERIMKNQYCKDTLDLLAYSVGYLEKDYPDISKFLDFILMADKRVNNFNISLGDTYDFKKE